MVKIYSPPKKIKDIVPTYGTYSSRNGLELFRLLAEDEKNSLNINNKKIEEDKLFLFKVSSSEEAIKIINNYWNIILKLHNIKNPLEGGIEWI